MMRVVSLKKENDKEAIARIINYYLDGTRSDNPDLMRKAFQPDVTLKFIDKEGSYKMIPIKKFFSYFTNTKSRLFENKIYYIDISGSTANVKLTAKYEAYKYIDYMNILKTKNGWKIVSKISHQDFL
ncbi:nuclear transport factor 2 family protein [Tenacibaculum aquimarinum]|uniref:nuclear transport factor 2 family protein n=1 Tax=Tenacibaculum aquimarinum TaxID=2910675 RepID=UPI001F0AD531|nr:nuclear transport factor 2 family protein [Tenacibaculum aquimarinum]MCH3882191.1 nuclear transport factor 2 family protein [Tenacibaculum aquimarinum]